MKFIEAVLHRAAGIIEERGWRHGDGRPGPRRRGAPVMPGFCAMDAIAAAVAEAPGTSRATGGMFIWEAREALRAHLGLTGAECIIDWNDGGDAATVTAGLRAAATAASRGRATSGG